MQEVLDDKAAHIISGDISIEKHVAVFPFRNVSVDIVANRANDLLIERGYKLESGGLTNAAYGKGSQLLRILVGAFAKRFCWIVKVEPIDDYARLTLVKDAKGYVGGIIGVNQVNKEYKQITDVFTDLHRELSK